MVFFERCVQVEFRSSKGRRESKKQTRKNRDAKRECEDAPVEMDFGKARQVVAILRSNKSESCLGKEEPCGTSQKGHENALCQQKHDEATLAGAERKADGNFLAARCSAGEQEVSHVGASDDE